MVMSDMEIKVEPTSNGTRLVLPRRDLGPFSRLGWAGIAIGVITTIFMFGWMYVPVTSGIEELRKGNSIGWFLILFGMTGLVGLFFALKSFSAGLAILRNQSYCEINLRTDKITSRERVGWFSFKSKVDYSDVKAIHICPALSDIDSERPKRPQVVLGSNWLPKDLGVLFLNKNKKNPMAIGCRADLLRDLADLLRDELQPKVMTEIKVVDKFNVASTRVVDVAAASNALGVSVSVDVEAEERLELPEDSDLEVSELDGAAVYRVPSRGLLKGSHGLFPFSILWNGFMVVFTSVVLRGLKFQGAEDWFVVAFIVVFWLVGIGLMIGAFYLARQSAMIGVRDGVLFIERKTIFGTKWIEFEPNQVTAIEVGAGGMEVNDVPVQELQIYPHEQDKIGMLAHLADEELDWLAQNLREQLGLRPDNQAWVMSRFDLDQELSPPASSKVTVHQSDEATTIDVPELGLWSAKFGVFFAMVLTFLSFPITIALMLRFGFDLFMIVVPLFTTLMGIGMLVYLLINRTRRFHVRATDRVLSIQRRGYWSNYDFEVDRKDLLNVGPADSGVRTNGKMEMTLQVKCDGQSNFSMMYGRDEMEIGYVAALVQQRMKLRAEPDN